MDNSPFRWIKPCDLNDIVTSWPVQLAHTDLGAKRAEDTHVILCIPVR